VALGMNINQDKQEVWHKTLLVVDRIADGLKEHIDEGIKETVTALIVNGFVTNSSCGGHLDRALPYPWVDLSTPEPNGWEENKDIKQQWETSNRSQYQKLLVLLDEFYADRLVDYNVMLMLDCANFAGFRLQSVGGYVLENVSDEVRQAKFRLYENEMKDFTEFLKNKYFGE